MLVVQQATMIDRAIRLGEMSGGIVANGEQAFREVGLLIGAQAIEAFA